MTQTCSSIAVNLRGFFDVAVETMCRGVAHASSAAWQAPSGSAEWNGRQVLEHVLSVNAQARAMAAGIDVRVDAPTPDPLDVDDPLESYRASAQRTWAAFDDIDVPHRPLRSPMGMFPGRVVLSVTAIENFVHAWDLSVAAGTPLELDPVAVGYAARAVEDMPELWHNFRHWGAYGPVLDHIDSADPTAALLAVLGRDALSSRPTSARGAG